MDEDNFQQKLKSDHRKTLNIILPVVVTIGLIIFLLATAKTPIEDHDSLIPGGLVFLQIMGYLILVVDAVHILIVFSALLYAAISYVRVYFLPLEEHIIANKRIRMGLGHKLILAIEFAIGGEFLHLAIAPNTKSIAILFTKVLLRFLLGYILEHDVKISEE